MYISRIHYWNKGDFTPLRMEITKFLFFIGGLSRFSL